MKRLLLFFGSTAYTGLFPIAPATVSSFLIAVILTLWGPGPGALWMVTVLGIVVSVPLASWMEREFGHDPSACTVDELAGYLLALALLSPDLGTPGAWKIIWAGFFLFRFFDIAKIWPANRLERLPGGWGIVADDLMAGVYSAVVLALLRMWWLS